MGWLDFLRAPKDVNAQPDAQFRNAKASPSAILSNANFKSIVPSFRTGTSATERGLPGRPVMQNVPTTVVGKSHQKYDSPPFPGGEMLVFNYTPYQRQARPNMQQRQYGYPRPGIDLRPPDATYGSDGLFSEGNMSTRVEAPFAGNNRPPNIAPRPSEMLQDFGRPNFRPPLSYYLSQKTPVGMNPEMQFAHKMTSGLTPYAPARDYPPSTVGWTHREYFTDKGAVPGINPPFAPATKQRGWGKMSAPPQLQASAGGLTISSYALVQRNLNSNLTDLYKGATAPVAQAYSAMC
jgi:hypothetical protein